MSSIKWALLIITYLTTQLSFSNETPLFPSDVKWQENTQVITTFQKKITAENQKLIKDEQEKFFDSSIREFKDIYKETLAVSANNNSTILHNKQLEIIKKIYRLPVHKLKEIKEELSLAALSFGSSSAHLAGTLYARIKEVENNSINDPYTEYTNDSIIAIQSKISDLSAWTLSRQSCPTPSILKAKKNELDAFYLDLKNKSSTLLRLENDYKLAANELDTEIEKLEKDNEILSLVNETFVFKTPKKDRLLNTHRSSNASDYEKERVDLEKASSCFTKVFAKNNLIDSLRSYDSLLDSKDKIFLSIPKDELRIAPYLLKFREKFESSKNTLSQNGIDALNLIFHLKFECNVEISQVRSNKNIGLALNKLILIHKKIETPALIDLKNKKDNIKSNIASIFGKPESGYFSMYIHINEFNKKFNEFKILYDSFNLTIEKICHFESNVSAFNMDTFCIEETNIDEYYLKLNTQLNDISNFKDQEQVH